MNICDNCFNDLEIKNYIETNSQAVGECDFCKKADVKTLELTELLDFFSEFVGVFENNDDYGIPLSELINRDWNIFSYEKDSKLILNKILELLGSHIKSSGSKVFYNSNIEECVQYWEQLKENLKWNRRFLTDVDAIINLGWDSFFNSETDLPKDKIFYRARIHSSDNQNPYPRKEMGCPPKEFATNGRANPDGIPFLYLSENHKTTLYETRVTYLDDVSIGSFKLLDYESLILVDFNSYDSPFLHMGNINENAKSRLLKEKIRFDLSKPIRRYDSQLEYLPTQFICEFIRYITGAGGIIFNSSLHKGGVNYVIFESEKLQCIDVEKYQVTSVVIEGQKI